MPWRPFWYKCRSNGTPAARSDSLKTSAFSTLTPGSSTVCQTKRGRQVAAGRRADDADLLGVEAPHLRVGAHRPHRAGRVLKDHGHRVAVLDEPVLENERRHAEVVEPLGERLALVRRQRVVA